MSEMRGKLANAIHEAFSSQGEMATAYVLIVASSDVEGERSILVTYSDDIVEWEYVGLLKYAWTTIGNYWGDRAGVIWVECPKHGTYETTNESIAWGLVRLHDYCQPVAAGRCKDCGRSVPDVGPDSEFYMSGLCQVCLNGPISTQGRTR